MPGRNADRRAGGKTAPVVAPVRRTQLASRDVFYTRIRRGASYALALVATTLAIGIVGYHELEHMSWLDAFHQSALLLSGMGPVVDIKSAAGKIFDSIYALFCGVILLAATGLMFAPVIHRLLHRFHIEDAGD
jgi:TRAP-type C4-dicarboxylate transport system permease small subunit